MKTPWQVTCEDPKLSPKLPVTAKYALISKTALCECSIQVGHITLPRNIQYCQRNDMGSQLKVQYSVNQAVLNYYPDESQGIAMDGQVQFDEPTMVILTPRKTNSTRTSHLVRHMKPPTDLHREIELQNRTHRVFEDANEKIQHDLKDVSRSLLGKVSSKLAHMNWWQYILIVVSGIAVMMVIVSGVYLYFHKKRWSHLVKTVRGPLPEYFRGKGESIRRSLRESFRRMNPRREAGTEPADPEPIEMQEISPCGACANRERGI